MSDWMLTKPALCPRCGQVINAVLPLDPADPRAPVAEPGDVTFCANCAAMLVFDEDVLPVAVTDEQRTALLREMPELAQAEQRAHNLAALVRQLRAYPAPPSGTGS